MTPWTLDWDPVAEQELTRLWLNAPDRRAMTVAQARAEGMLARDPLGHGQHLSEGLYLIRVPPLTLHYTIDDDAKHVEVTWVSYTP